MKKCNTEIMKDIKKLEEMKSSLLTQERTSCTVSYLQGEKPIDTGYDYEKLSSDVEACDKEIRRLKALLAYANVTTQVEGFNMSISEALVYLAQLSDKLSRLENLVRIKPIDRRSPGYSSTPEFTVIVFDREKVLKEYNEVRDLIPQLQMAIDRTNLNNMIEC